MKQRHILPYLHCIQWFMAFYFLAGCQGETPLINITHSPYGLFDPLQVDKYQAGHFEGDAQLTRFVRERLDERLTQIMSISSESPDDKPADRIVPDVQPVRTFVISGSVHPSRGMGLDERFEATDRLKMVVVIAASESKGATRTIRFSYMADPDFHSEQMRSVLSGWVDRIVKRIYRSDRKTMTRLGRGKSRYDRQGRTWVSEGEHRKALGAFLQAIDDQPSDPASLYNAGLLCEALGDYRRAFGFHKRARKLANVEDYQLATMRVETILLSGQVTE